MKRIIALLLSLVLLAGSVSFAEPAASQAVVTVNGIRAAFFSDGGAYLPPLEENGLVWVPAVSLGESLGLAVTADPETAAVTVDGVRVAFFDEAGNYLAPFSKNGTVYVPLVAFAASAGIEITEDGNAFALKREDAAKPESAGKPVELFGLVPLTSANYTDYFMFSETYTTPQGYPNPYSITFTLTVTATTGYEPVNVEFLTEQYGLIRIPATGQASSGYRTDPIYGTAKSMDYINSVAIAVGNAAVEVLTPPAVTSVSGFMRMSKAEADRINEVLYRNALRLVENSDTIPLIEKASETLVRLQQAGYPVADSGLEAARAKRREIEAEAKKNEAKRQEEERSEKYSLAVQALENGSWEKAITLFTELKADGYLDSAEQLEEALRLKDESTLRDAETQIDSGNWKKAFDLLTPLAEKDFGNSRNLLETLNAAMQERYQDAVALEKSGQFHDASLILRELADMDFLDSKTRLAAESKAESSLKAEQAAYEKGVHAERNGKWSDALNTFFTCVDYSNTKAHIISCLLNAENAYILPPMNDCFCFTWGKINGYANMKTGELQILDIVRFPMNNTQVEACKNGFWLFSKDGNTVGLMNPDGSIFLKSEWFHISFLGGVIHPTCKSGRGPFINPDGTPYVEGEWYLADTKSDYWEKSGDTENGPRVYACSGRLITSPDGREPVLSSDGQIYWIGSRDGLEILYAPDGTELLTAEKIFHDRPSVNSWERFHMHNGVIAFCSGDKWGFWDTQKNRQLAKPSFSAVYCFTESGAARFCRNKKYGMFSSSGKTLVTARYENMDPIKNGMARVSKPGTKTVAKKKEDVIFCGFVNDSGKETIPMKYLAAGEFDRAPGRVWVAIDHGTIKKGAQTFFRHYYYVLDENGKKVMSFENDFWQLLNCLLINPSVYCMPVDKPYPYPCELDQQCCLYLNGGEKVSHQFDTVTVFNDRLLVTQDKRNVGSVYFVYDSTTLQEIMSYTGKSKLQFSLVSTEDSFLLMASGKDDAPLYWLFTSQYEKYTVKKPASLSAPTEADIARIAKESGL